MKLLLLIVLATFSFAATHTQYKTPVFTVENSTLYCTKDLRFKDYDIIKYNPGDLVSGDYASKNCSYNFESITDRIDARILELELKEEEDKKTDNSFGVGSFLILICFIALLFIYLSRNTEED